MHHTETPEDHPMWPTQVALERAMTTEGSDRVHAIAAKAERERKMTTLAPVRGLMEDWLPLLADGLKEWRRAHQNARGPKPIALGLLKDMDPYVASLVALRVVLDGITEKRTNFGQLASEVGRRIEHEQQVRLWEAQDRDSFRSLQKYLDRTDATAGHRALVNINRFNALLKEGKFAFDWRYWAPEEHLRVGIALLDIVVRTTGWFEYAPDVDHVWKRGQKKAPARTIVAKPGLLEWIAKSLDQQAAFSPVYRPTVVPPKRWDGTRSGAYWTPYVRTPRLIRFKASQRQQQEGAADEYDALDMPKVYEALHFLQEVPWSVNQRVFFVAEHVMSAELGLGKMPLASELKLPDKPGLMAAAPPLRRSYHNAAPILDEETGEVRGQYRKSPILPPLTASEEAGARWVAQNPKLVQAWKRKATKVYRENRERLSKHRLASRTLRVAKEFSQFDRFYFPHMMDFRGRFYPIPVGLQPQGDDLARGLLQFAEGREITKESGGYDWLAIHLASVWGNDKWDFKRRIAWVEERGDLWRRIARDPLANIEWSTADKPWQALAAIFEWVAFLDHGFGYVSHLPISVDGTCNGIQHLAAMTRDQVAGAYVNLVPAQEPQDIYKFVAKLLQAKLEDLEAAGATLSGQHASYWLNLTSRDLPRSLTKRQVMVLPYGGTKDSYYKYTREWLDEVDPEQVEEEWDEDERKAARDLRNSRLAFLVNHLWDTVNEAVQGGVSVMHWLKRCAKPATQGNQPIYWVTPSGFTVRHFYGKIKAKQVKTDLDGMRVDILVHEVTKDLDIESQLRGIAPNFVHSLDAAALVLTINRAEASGIRAFSAVHDAYGSHAADMWALYGHLRDAFVEVHEQDVLGTFRAACADVLKDFHLGTTGGDPMEAYEMADETLPPMPEMGDLKLPDVRRSDYFFA